MSPSLSYCDGLWLLGHAVLTGWLSTYEVTAHWLVPWLNFYQALSSTLSFLYVIYSVKCPGHLSFPTPWQTLCCRRLAWGEKGKLSWNSD